MPVQAQELCGGVEYPFPYTDVSGVGAAFCPGIMEAYVTGVSKGTTPTTFSPNETVTRVQMTTFLQRSLDQGLTRVSRRAALNQWSIPQNTASMQTIPSGAYRNSAPRTVQDIWTSAGTSGPGAEQWWRALGTWTKAERCVRCPGSGWQGLCGGRTSPGGLYVIDPTQPPGDVTVAASNLGNHPVGIAFDGTNLWTANYTDGSVSIITLQARRRIP